MASPFDTNAANEVGSLIRFRADLVLEMLDHLRSLDQSAGNLKALRVQAGVRAAAELRASTGRIAAELPPEKRAEFYRLSAQRYERLGLSPPQPSTSPP